MGNSLSCQHTLLLHVWRTGAGPVLNHLWKVLLGVVSRVRLWKQQLNLLQTDPRDLKGVIWKSLQLFESLSMARIIPREVSHVSPCDPASAPPYFPDSPGIHTDFRAELPGGELPSPVLLHSLGGVGLQIPKQIQGVSVQNRSLQAAKPNILQPTSYSMVLSLLVLLC